MKKFNFLNPAFKFNTFNVNHSHNDFVKYSRSYKNSLLNLGLSLNMLLLALPTSAQGIGGTVIRYSSSSDEETIITKQSGQLQNGCDEIRILHNKTYILSCGGTTTKVLPTGDVILEDGTILKMTTQDKDRKDDRDDRDRKNSINTDKSINEKGYKSLILDWQKNNEIPSISKIATMQDGLCTGTYTHPTGSVLLGYTPSLHELSFNLNISASTAFILRGPLYRGSMYFATVNGQLINPPYAPHIEPYNYGFHGRIRVYDTQGKPSRKRDLKGGDLIMLRWIITGTSKPNAFADFSLECTIPPDPPPPPLECPPGGCT